MAISRLKAIAAELKQEKETEVAMKVARKRQLSMLPSTPTIPGYDFHTKYLPASKVSGDFYEFIPVTETSIGMAMGDVTGHGVEAGLVMGMAMAAIGIMGTGVESPKDILSAVNNYLAPKLDGETFFSASYGILDYHNHTFRFARAGHNPPILYNPRRSPALTQLSPPGMVIGVDKTGKRFPKAMEEWSSSWPPATSCAVHRRSHRSAQPQQGRIRRRTADADRRPQLLAGYRQFPHRD